MVPGTLTVAKGQATLNREAKNISLTSQHQVHQPSEKLQVPPVETLTTLLAKSTTHSKPKRMTSI